MNKGIKIIYRKAIKHKYMLIGFEKLSGNKLPDPSSFKNTRTWQFNLKKESGLKSLEELLNLFELPLKKINTDRLFCKMIVYNKDDVIFEVHEWDKTYQVMTELRYI